MNNKKKCINIIAYIIVVILAVFYLATLVLGSKLDVSDEYKPVSYTHLTLPTSDLA